MRVPVLLTVIAITGTLTAPLPMRGQEDGPAYRSAFAVEAETGTVLFEHEPRIQMPVGALTKLMLMLVVAESVRNGELRWHDPVRTSRWASKMGGTQVYLAEGEVFPLLELFKAVAVRSANDAAVAIAEHAAGSVDAFVERMNLRARDLGMNDTKFYNVHGLPPENGQLPDVSSARDLATLARALVDFPEVLEWTRAREIRFRNESMLIPNENGLVRGSDWADGLHAGAQRGVGFHAVGTGERDGLRVIAVVLGAKKEAGSYEAALRLLHKAVADYRKITVMDLGDVVAVDLRVRGGNPEFIRAVSGGRLVVVRKKSEKPSFTKRLVMEGSLRPPLRTDQAIGEVVLYENGAEIGRVPAFSAEPVEKAGLLQRIF